MDARLREARTLVRACGERGAPIGPDSGLVTGGAQPIGVTGPGPVAGDADASVGVGRSCPRAIPTGWAEPRPMLTRGPSPSLSASVDVPQRSPRLRGESGGLRGPGSATYPSLVTGPPPFGPPPRSSRAHGAYLLTMSGPSLWLRVPAPWLADQELGTWSPAPVAPLSAPGLPLPPDSEAGPSGRSGCSHRAGSPRPGRRRALPTTSPGRASSPTFDPGAPRPCAGHRALPRGARPPAETLGQMSPGRCRGARSQGDGRVAAARAEP